MIYSKDRIYMENNIRVKIIDFAKPWWRVIFKQKSLLLSVVIAVLIRDIFWALEPFLVAKILTYQNWYFFAGACLLWILFEIDLIVMSVLNPRFQLGIIHSVLYSAHQHLLVVDPIYHIRRSSGEVLAKIERAGRGYEDMLDQITFDFAPMIIGVVSMLTVFGSYSLWLTVAVAGCIGTMVSYAYYFARYGAQKIEKKFIASDDAFKETAFENLSQIGLVRATFATDYMKNKLKDKVTINSQAEQVVWRSYSFVSRILMAIYIVSIIILVAFFMFHIKNNQSTLAQAISILLAYITSTRALIKIVNPMRKYMRGYTAVKDLFNAMQQFGKQTIPIFEGKSVTVTKESQLSLSAQNLIFGYKDAMVFNEHSFQLEVSAYQMNKLYGIIGPSGVGKTTLLSILGGQLKPIQGTVLINGINIYEVTDFVRKQLIALQGQIASSFKGSVRYNLLFGLPDAHTFDDAYLWHILERTGLKETFRAYHGLDTLLGEGALNISGGQRQRLNFAALYLRAQWYKPALILIDEPTSSLDEISERAITEMILELASSAITLVIAHRLKTLEQAEGLIDLSLLPYDKTIKTYKPEELKSHSTYYHLLLQGKLSS